MSNAPVSQVVHTKSANEPVIGLNEAFEPMAFNAAVAEVKAIVNIDILEPTLSFVPND